MCINYNILHVCGHRAVVKQKCEFGEVKWRGRTFPCIKNDIDTREHRNCIQCSLEPKIESDLTVEEIKCLLPDEQERLEAGDDHLKVIIRTEKYLKRSSFHTWFKTLTNPVFATKNEIETQILTNKALLVEREKARLRRKPNKTLHDMRWLHKLAIDHIECLRNLDAQKAKNEQEAAEKRAKSQTTDSPESGEAESSNPTTPDPESENAKSQANDVNAAILALGIECSKKERKGKEGEIVSPTCPAILKSTEAFVKNLGQSMPGYDQNENLDPFDDNWSHVLKNFELESSNPESQLPDAETHLTSSEYTVDELITCCEGKSTPIGGQNTSSRPPSRRENSQSEKDNFGFESHRSGKESSPEFDDDELYDWPQVREVERPESRLGFRPGESFGDDDEEQFTLRPTTESSREESVNEDDSVGPQSEGSERGSLSTAIQPLPQSSERPSQNLPAPQQISAYLPPGKVVICEIRKYLSMPESMTPLEMLHWWWRNRNVIESFLRGVQPFINESAAKTMLRVSEDMRKANEFFLSLMGTIDWQEVANSPFSIWEDDSDDSDDSGDERENKTVEEPESDGSTVFVCTIANAKPNEDTNRQKMVGGRRLWTKSPSRLGSVISIVKIQDLRPGENPLLLTDFDSADRNTISPVSSLSEEKEVDEISSPVSPIHEVVDNLYSYKSTIGAELLSTVTKHFELPLEFTPRQVSKWLDEQESDLVRRIREDIVLLPLTPSNENAFTDSEDAKNELIFAMQHIDWMEIDLEPLDLRSPFVGVNIEEVQQTWHEQPENQRAEIAQKTMEETNELPIQEKEFEKDDGNKSDKSDDSDDSVVIVTEKSSDQSSAKIPALSAGLSPQAPSFMPGLLRASASTVQQAPLWPQTSSFIPTPLRPQAPSAPSFIPATLQTSTRPHNVELGLCFRCKRRGHKFRDCLEK